MKLIPNSNVKKHIPTIHGGLYSVKTKREGIIDFSSNINPLGYHPNVKKYLKKQMKIISVYPDSESIELRKNLKWYTKVSDNQIVVGNGATEIIYNFCQAFLNNKTHILIPIPTFSEYEVASKLHGSKVFFFKTMNLNNNLDAFIKKIPTKGCIFICNPNNPTGILISKKNMQKIIIASLKKSSLVFADECFIELTDSTQSVLNYIKKYQNLFVLRSLTKSFGLAGLRIGYGISNKKIIRILNNIKIPWNVSGIAQKAASAALCYSNYLDETTKIISLEKSFLVEAISKIDGFSCLPTDTNFILIKTKIKSDILQKKLLKKKILIRDCKSFRGLNNNYIRIAVKSHKDNIKLIKELEAI
ncbi:MAG TPA: histidinol-phosphate transaminase [Nitrosopumilaceae archaeon]|nr:histidinol-phosphate transaminase [Nitrosopumilaceae archaeon]